MQDVVALIFLHTSLPRWMGMGNSWLKNSTARSVCAWGAQEALGFTCTVRSLERSKLWRVLSSDTERDAELWCNFQIGAFNLGYTLTLELPAALKINAALRTSNFNFPIVYYYLSKIQVFYFVFTSGGNSYLKLRWTTTNNPFPHHERKRYIHTFTY